MLRWGLALVLAAGAAACGGNISPMGGGGGGNGDGGIIDAPVGEGGGGGRDANVSQGDAGCGLVTCESVGANCGPIGDGCGGVIQCGTCTLPETCGGGGPSVCGGTGGCVPRTCADVGATCGPVADGCGSMLDCGSCTSPETCGGGGVLFKCGQNPPGCVPRTCADLGATCGAQGDGCGGLITGGCGDCNLPDICGGGGVPNQCGGGTPPDGGVPCTGLCQQQVTCPSGTTSITGTVYAPNGKEPLYGALVYVPNAPVDPFTPGVACLRCADEVSGAPLVSTMTDYRGQFQLDNMPVGADIPLVIQLGRWRRQITIANVGQCVNTPIAATQTRLPRNQSEGDIPLTAMVTGNVDQLECVLRKIGIDAAEFTLPSGNGRIKMYYENGVHAMSSSSGNNIPDASTLWGSQTELDKYDMVIFACEGGQYNKGANEKGRVRAYADKGGRVFATHYSYTWTYDNDPWGCGDGCTTAGHTVGNWNINSGSGTSTTGTVDTTFPKGQAFSQWLDVVNASTAPGSNQITINDWRHDLDWVYPSPTAQRWIYVGTNMVEHATFNTPVGTPQDQQCGRVLFSDFHVTNASGLNGDYLFHQCNQTADLTAQEKVLEFMLFDLASCITPDVPPPPSCTPKTCTELNAECGYIGDGCGNALDCGPCVEPGETCGGGGVPNQCGQPGCVPLSCAQLNLECGPAGDGCGTIIDCGPCVPPDTCGGGGTPGVCGHSSCVPLTCQQVGAECGMIGDGCGGQVDCGPCEDPLTCGGGGVPNICGSIG